MRHGWLIALAMAGTLASGGCQGDRAGELSGASPASRVQGVGFDSPESRIKFGATKDSRAHAGRTLNSPESTTRAQLVDVNDIEAAFKTDKTRCEAYEGRERNACLEVAQREYERKLADARMRREGTQRSGEMRRSGRARLLAC